MNTQDPPEITINKPRRSLEQRLRLVLRKFRAAERRRHKRRHKPACPSEPRCLRGLAAMAVAPFVLAAFSFAARAASTAPTFDQANSTFAAGNYRAAISQYEAVLAHDGCSAPVLFNLGNADYRDGQFGAAILNYERAQVLAPRDNSIAANLRLARERAGVPAPTLNVFEQAANYFSPNTLAWTGSGALTVICLTIIAGRFVPRFAKSKSIIGIAVAVVLAVAASFAIRWPEFNRAIVVAANAPARIAPASTAAESFALKAGEPVTIAKVYGQFALARTADGRSGWVNEQEIGRVFAPQSELGVPGKL
jgi:tetratricopeptide (TPR) repeat protein